MDQQQKKSLTLGGMTGVNFLFIMNALVMIGVSIYLTSHFYEARYPKTLGGGKTLCDLSNFFNCDAATFSPVSNIAGVPISWFGIVVGLLFLFSSLMPSENLEKTSSAVSKYNFIGCLVLFVYSLAVLGSLCPFCTAYYALSGLAFFLFWKYGMNTWKPEAKTAGFWGVLLLIGAFFFHQTTKGKEETSGKLNASVVEQYRTLTSVGDPDMESPFKIHMATEKFADAPIRISIFSDFECPFCKVVSEQLPEIIRRYGNKVNIQYFFYPLDSKCNSNVTRGFHKHACDAAFIAACDPKKFHKVHDEIFEGQTQLGNGVLGEIAERNSLKGCGENKDVQNMVISLINQSSKYNLKSTPTIVINGKKIEGSIPNAQYFAIFEDILAGTK